MALRAELVDGASEEAESDPSAARRDEGSHEHKTYVMLGNNGPYNAHTKCPNANERALPLRGCFYVVSEAMGGDANIE